MRSLKYQSLLGDLPLFKWKDLIACARILPGIDLLLLFSSDSDSAPLLKRCEGHLAGRPMSGELLLSGGGAPQQARGGSQVRLAALSLVSLVCPLLLPTLCFLMFLLP